MPTFELDFGFPESAKMGSKIPKNTFYKKGLKPKIKQYFINQIQEITWAFKLNQETLNLIPANEIEELEVMMLTLHQPSLSFEVLQAIDELIKDKPIVFILKVQIQGETLYQAQMAYKTSPKTKQHYFQTPWQGELHFNLQSLDLNHLYQSLFLQVARNSLTPKPYQPIENTILNHLHCQSLHKKLQTLEKKYHQTQGLKARLALRENILKIKRQIEELG